MADYSVKLFTKETVQQKRVEFVRFAAWSVQAASGTAPWKCKTLKVLSYLDSSTDTLLAYLDAYEQY